MGDTPDGSPRAALGAQTETDPDSPGRANFLSRLFRWDTHEDDEETKPNGSPVAGARMAGEMLVNLQKLTGLRVEDVAVPRADIVAVAADAPLDEVVRVFRDSGATRLPVYDETLDRPIGLVHLKDFALRFGFGAEADGFDLRALARPLLYVPHSMPIGALLQKMQAARGHMALVIDEYGGVDGLVTIEDILEQVVGEIGDEHDEEEGPLWASEGTGVYIAHGRLDLDEFAAEAGVSLGVPDLTDEVDTLGGLVTQLAGRLPIRGEIVLHPEGHEFEVLDADARKLKRLRVRLAGAGGYSTVVGRAAE